MPSNSTYIKTSSTVTIASSGTVSTALDVAGNTICGVYIPATFTGTALTFQASYDNATFVPVYGTDGNILTRTVAAGRYYAFHPSELAGIKYLKLVSGSAEAAGRTLYIAQRILG